MFGSTYQDHLYVPGDSDGGSQNEDGSWNPGTAAPPKYNGKCDAQEPGQGGGFKFTSGDTQLESISADLVIFLEDESKVEQLTAGDRGTLTRFGNEYQITITNTRRIDGMIEANTI